MNTNNQKRITALMDEAWSDGQRNEQEVLLAQAIVTTVPHPARCWKARHVVSRPFADKGSIRDARHSVLQEPQKRLVDAYDLQEANWVVFATVELGDHAREYLAEIIDPVDLVPGLILECYPYPHGVAASLAGSREVFHIDLGGMGLLSLHDNLGGRTLWAPRDWEHLEEFDR
jgi:hypothetical protein